MRRLSRNTGTGDRPYEERDQGVRRDGCPQGHGDDRGAAGGSAGADCREAACRTIRVGSGGCWTAWRGSTKVRACYEASGAGYVLERKIRSWGHDCEIVAPSLIPRRPGERRKHDRKDAEELARLYRAGELVTIRVPTEREERVRDLVRCRGTFQREILKSRHYNV